MRSIIGMVGPSLLRSEVSPTVTADATGSGCRPSISADALPRDEPASCNTKARFPGPADTHLGITRPTSKGFVLASPVVCPYNPGNSVEHIRCLSLRPYVVWN